MKLGTTERFRRIPEAAPAARLLMRRWLPARGTSEAVDQLVLAASEAINNVINHASGLDFVVTVDTEDERASVIITDAGHGFAAQGEPVMPPATATRHRGLALMRALVDHAEITSTPAGTTVTLTHHLDRTPATTAETTAAHDPHAVPQPA